ncbi:MAG: alpha/beta fold hydrolase [Pseudomonadaceae bacterium]|nr:MAG: alpha/beta fold hydrolase [Pseudomonadaceae bacterium]
MGNPVEAFTLSALDGYPLAATLYPAEQDECRLLIASAAGTPQGYYRRFAEFARQQGFTALTLDYRGIGKSHPGDLRGQKMSIMDWANQDLAAAIDYLHDPQRPLYMVGHSLGGHAFGLLPNHAKVAGLYTFGTGAGWHGWMPPLERLRVWTMWQVFAPLIARRKGYLAWRSLGMGEDLPLGAYEQWRRWCSFPRYYLDDPLFPEAADLLAQVTSPIMAANALDDAWALPRSRDAFMPGYLNAPWQVVDIDPQRVSTRKIGHMGYFRSHAEPLWVDALNWFRTL